MSAQAGTSPPKPNLLPCRSPCGYLKLPKRSRLPRWSKQEARFLPAHFCLCNVLGGDWTGERAPFCLTGPISNQQKSTAAIWKRQPGTDRWTVAPSALLPPGLSARGYLNGRTSANLSSTVKQPTRTRIKSIRPTPLFDTLRANCT